MTDLSPATRDHLGRVARGGTIGMVGALTSAAAGFALAVVVSRGLSPTSAGTFFACTTVFLMLASVSSLGTDTGLARFLMRHEAAGRPDDVALTFRAAAVPALTLALVAAAALEVTAPAIAGALGVGDTGSDVLRILAPFLPCAVAADLALSATRAFGRMRETVFIDKLVRAGLQPVAVGCALLVGGGTTAVAAGWTAVYVVSAVLAFLAARRCFRSRARRRGGRPPRSDLRPLGDRSVGREFWRFTWPRGVTRTAQLAIQKADIVIVAALLSPADAAFYTVATRFVALGQFATLAFQQVLQPRFTAILLHDDTRTLRDVYRIATGWNLVVAWPVYLIVGCAPAAYLAIFGDTYSGDIGGQVVVMTMAGAMLLAVASGPVDTLLLMAGRSRTSMANAMVALTLDIGLCLVLVPRFGIAGAGAAWALAVLTRCGLAFGQVWRTLSVTPVGVAVGVAAALPVTCIGLPVLLVSVAVPGRLGAWAAVVALSGLLYLVALWRFRRVLRLDLLVESIRSASGRAAGSREGATGMRGLRQLTQRARTRLPAPVVAVARRVVLAWGKLTADLRMTPSFVIVGAQRSGTTTLFRLLEAHPNLIRPTLSKGTGYFDDHYGEGPRWYRAHFPLRALAGLFARRPVSTFECSGYYLFHPLAAERIARDLPGVKVVAMLRDPVARAHSAHRHELARGFETFDFATAVALEPLRIAGEAERLLRDPGHRSFEHRHHAYLGRGEYAAQVRRLVEVFGPSRVYVLEADAFFGDPEAEFARLQRWLGIPVWSPPSVGRWNAEPGAPLPAEVRAALEERFAEPDAALAELLGRAPAWRTAEVSR